MLGHVDELGLLRCRAVDLLGHIRRDESFDLAVDARQDPKYLPPQRLRSHVHGDVGRPGFGHVDHDHQWFGRARGGPQRDVTVDDESLLVQPQVDDEFNDERNADREGDGVAEGAPHDRLLNLHLRGHPCQAARPLGHRADFELVAGDLSECRRHSFLGHSLFEESPTEVFVGDEGAGYEKDLVHQLCFHQVFSLPSQRRWLGAGG